MSSSSLSILLLCVGAAFGACAQPAANEPTGATGRSSDTGAEDGRGPRKAPWSAEEGLGFASNDGRYWITLLPDVEEFPLNETFGLELRVFDGATRSELVDAEVQVDARMPAHGHGMKQDVAPTEQPDGSYRVEDVLLHMVGHWELYVDLTDGAVTERAQFDIDLE